MQYKIGVFGSAVHEHSSAIAKTIELGKVLAQEKVIIITGGCSGMPYLAASEAAKQGAMIWGYSPNTSREEQLTMYPHDDINIYSQIFYVPQSYKDLFFAQQNLHFPEDDAKRKYRNVISTANCDAGIIISGRWGTLNEFTNLFDMGKVIGVLENTGGVADELKALTRKISKVTKADVLFNEDPKKLVHHVISVLRKRYPTK